MRVLSLFDGMSCGQLALQRAGIAYDTYYASEIDTYAMTVTRARFPSTIQLGDVTQWQTWDLPQIDLIIGGSPCQGFSSAGQRKQFDDPRSKLFWMFTDVLAHYNPRYFLLENVRMVKESEQVITEALGVEPIMIDSARVTGQSRKRMYWTNIPNVTQPEDTGVCLQDVIEDDATALRDKAYCLRAGQHANATPSVISRYFERRIGNIVLQTDGSYRVLTLRETERLQTLPDDYTAPCASRSQRYRMLGNGWTVDVIAHILKEVHNA